MTKAEQIIANAKKRIQAQPNYIEEMRKNMEAKGKGQNVSIAAILQDQQEKCGKIIFGKYWK